MSDTESKNKPASQRKLQKQREEGNVASAQDLSGLVSVAVGLAVFIATTALVWGQLTLAVVEVISLIHLPFENAIVLAADTVGKLLLLSIGPIVAAVIASAFIVIMVYNGGIIFAMKPVSPQLSRVSIKSGMKRIYGKRGWVELAFLILRLACWLAYVVILMIIFMPRLLRSTECSSLCQLTQILPMIWLLLIGAIVEFIVSAGIDMINQKNLFLDDQKMTESEVKREAREGFGSPEIRRERNRLRNESTSSTTIALGLENGTLVVFDVRDRAIAINYAPPDQELPRVVAKSLKPEATIKLIQDAAALGIPSVENSILVGGGISKNLGAVIDHDTFPEFVNSLKVAFNS